jgi:hypothetical protein
MAQAKQEGGLYYKPIGTTGKYVAVDANDQVVEGAPKRPANTDPSQQPAAGGLLSSEERVAVAVAKAMKDPDAVLSRAAAQSTPADATAGSDQAVDADELPTLADMPAYLDSITDVDEVRALQRTDDRKGAQDLYAARIDELGG